MKRYFQRIFASIAILSLLLPSCSIQDRQTIASTEAPAQEVMSDVDPTLSEGLTSSETPEQEVMSDVDPTLPEGLTSSETPEQEVVSDVDPTLPEGLTSSEWQSIQNQIMSNLSQQAYVKASNTVPFYSFDVSFAVSNDTIVIVGCFGDSAAPGVNGDQSDNSASGVRAAYVFVRDGTNWTQQAYLEASNTDTSDGFGWSVAISNDTIVVGASYEDSAAIGVNGDQNDNSAEDAGAAYVFVRSGTTWTQQAYLKASNTDHDDWFGDSVAVSNDTIVVGAFGEDSAATGVNGNQNDNSYSYAGAAYVFVRSGTTWTQQAYLKASNMDAGDSFGVSVAVSNDTIVVGAVGEDSATVGVNGDQNDNSVESAGAAYVFVRDGTTWRQQAYLKASNADAGDCFGSSVAISNDTIVVGAVGEDSATVGVNGDQNDNSVECAGAAYVFVRSGTTWTQQAYLKASITDDWDEFGYSVAVSNDTIVVGAAYVFVRDGTTWTQQAYLKASNTDAEVYFGRSVAVSNDTIVICAVGESIAAYVFVSDGTTWTQQAYLKESNTDAYDHFGSSVVVSNDTIVVGAWGESSAATGVNGYQYDFKTNVAGAAYVFVRDGTTWTQQAYLKASNTDTGDRFGYSVAVSNDTIVVGAFGEDSAATGVNGNQSDNSARSAGAAYVFVRDGTTWTQQAYLKASNTDDYAHFGSSVAVSNDTIVVGASYEDSAATGVNGDQNDNSAEDAGAAYVFVRDGTTWTQQAYLKASNTDAGDRFGVSVAVSNDTVVVGAYYESSVATGVNGNQYNNSAGYAGAAYVFVRSGTTWTQQAYLKASNTDHDDWFGSSVAVSNDTIVVGAWSEDSAATGVNGNQSDNSASGSGAAYVFVRDGTTWAQQAYLKASNMDAGDCFGCSVAVSNDTIVVGAYWEDSAATGVDGDQNDNSAGGAGAAYVFVRDGTTWRQQAYLKASNADAGDIFGESVAVSDDTIVVGAEVESSAARGVNGNQNDNGAPNSGAAYVFVGELIVP